MNKKLLVVPLVTLLIMYVGYNLFFNESDSTNIIVSDSINDSDGTHDYSTPTKLNHNLSTQSDQHIKTQQNRDTKEDLQSANFAQNSDTTKPIYDQKNYEPEDAKVLLESVIGDDGTIDTNAVASALGSDNFDVFLNQLRANASVEESAKELEVEQILLKSANIASYSYDLSCGIEVCALNLTNVPQDDIQELSKNITSGMPLGSIFKTNYKDEYGNAAIRVIYQIEQTSTLVTRRNGSNNS